MPSTGSKPAFGAACAEADEVACGGSCLVTAAMAAVDSDPGEAPPSAWAGGRAAVFVGGAALLHPTAAAHSTLKSSAIALHGCRQFRGATSRIVGLAPSRHNTLPTGPGEVGAGELGSQPP